jgi:hypothetical protein
MKPAVVAIGAGLSVLAFVVKPADFVFYGGMAGKTLNFVFGYMVLMEELGRIFRLQDLPLIMALKAGIFCYMTIPGDYARVALVALDAPCNISLVIEGESLANLDIAARLEVTLVTPDHVRRLVLGLIEVADETLHVCHGHMSALDYLGMTGRAPKLLLPLHLLYVPRVAEEDILEYHVILQIGPLVASALQTTGIVNFGMGFCGTLPCNKIDER